MKRKLLCAVVTLTLLAGLAGTVSAVAEADDEFDIRDGVLVKYNGPGGDVVIPDGVTEIGNEAFGLCYTLTSVVIADGVKNIGSYAFAMCWSLKSVEISNSVTNISDWAFAGCYSLGAIILPNGIKRIGEGIFAGCNSLTSIVLHDSITDIGEYAFQKCAFASVTIPENVLNIGYRAFYKCSALETIDVASKNPNYSSIDGVLYNKTETQLICYPSGKRMESYTVPVGTTVISDSAFAFSNALFAIAIPYGVKKIDDYTFLGCDALASVTIPDSVIDIGNAAFTVCMALTSIVIPKNVTSIGSRAFADCRSLTSIVIPNGVTQMDSSVFDGCPTDLVIYGEPGSYAQEYAETWEMLFVKIEDLPQPGISAPSTDNTRVIFAVLSAIIWILTYRSFAA